MKRTTIYLTPELEVLVKLEMLRQNRPMADIVREAVEAYVAQKPGEPPPGAGSFASGETDTAERVDDLLGATGFGSTRAQRARLRTGPKKKRR